MASATSIKALADFGLPFLSSSSAIRHRRAIAHNPSSLSFVCGLSYRMCEGLTREALGRKNTSNFATLQKRISMLQRRGK